MPWLMAPRGRPGRRAGWRGRLGHVDSLNSSAARVGPPAGLGARFPCPMLLRGAGAAPRARDSLVTPCPVRPTARASLEFVEFDHHGYVVGGPLPLRSLRSMAAPATRS